MRRRLTIIQMGTAVFGLACTAWCEVVFTLDFSRRAQTVEHIGSSTGMHGDYISKHWKPEVVDSIAELLFSREFDDRGHPKGIGLSSFRIQIGGGAEGVESGIRAPWRRTDCFLRPDGSYDWKNQGQGTLYWRKKTSEFSVPTVIGYLNSPPVYFTHSGYVFKTEKLFTSNLKDEHFGDYAEFISRVAAHFQSLELPFTHISPVNEPQWFWQGIPGRAKQEGSPWTNEQIARLVRLADREFIKTSIRTKLLIPEAAEYPALYAPLPDNAYAAASDQLRAFWSPESETYVGNLQSLENAAAGHAYFSDGSIEQIKETRLAVRKAVAEVGAGLRFWQTEYSLLGRGWTGGQPASEVDEMMAGLLLARTIHADFTLADASAWQWWSSTEPKLGSVPRYCLIECDEEGSEQFRTTKLLWALGHYSRFVRPGMVRIEVEPAGRLDGVMSSAFFDAEEKCWVMVLINFTDTEQKVVLELNHFSAAEDSGELSGFLTDKTTNLGRYAIVGNSFIMPPQSLVTVVSRER
ncbi:MAG: glycoside hydrolase [Pontiella sp.]